MKIVGGRGIGADKEKSRIIEIEPGDVVGKQFQVHSEGNDLWVTYYEDGPSGRMVVMLDDPVETAEPPAPFWVKPLCKHGEVCGGFHSALNACHAQAGSTITTGDNALLPASSQPQGQPPTWELLAQDLIRDARAGMVDIVAESCLQGMIISGWQGEARKRLLSGLAMGITEAKP